MAHSRLSQIYANLLAWWHEVDYQHVAGVSCSGWNALAGPLTVCACILYAPPYIRGLDAAESLTPYQRRRIATFLVQEHRAQTGNVELAFASLDNRYIDRHGIDYASLHATEAALNALRVAPEIVIADSQGKLVLNTAWRCRPSIKGLMPSENGARTDAPIIAADILARVHREHHMRNQHSRYSKEYGFASNAGYHTVAHERAIMRLGLSPLHRATACSDLEPPGWSEIWNY